MAGSGKAPSIRTLWGLAKSEELHMEDEDLYALVSRETGKDSLRKLTQGELKQVAHVLQEMKDSVQRANGRRPPAGQRLPAGRKRTDEGGDPRTTAQRRKIYTLCGELGWNGDHRRVNGMSKKMFGVERIEWLSPAQCGTLIEALKAMAARKEAEG